MVTQSIVEKVFILLTDVLVLSGILMAIYAPLWMLLWRKSRSKNE